MSMTPSTSQPLTSRNQYQRVSSGRLPFQIRKNWQKDMYDQINTKAMSRLPRSFHKDWLIVWATDGSLVDRASTTMANAKAGSICEAASSTPKMVEYQ